MTSSEENQLRRWAQSHAPAGSWTAARVLELLDRVADLEEDNRSLSRENVRLRELVGELNVRCGEAEDAVA